MGQMITIAQSTDLTKKQPPGNPGLDDVLQKYVNKHYLSFGDKYSNLSRCIQREILFMAFEYKYPKEFKFCCVLQKNIVKCLNAKDDAEFTKGYSQVLENIRQLSNLFPNLETRCEDCIVSLIALSKTREQIYLGEIYYIGHKKHESETALSNNVKKMLYQLFKSLEQRLTL